MSVALPPEPQDTQSWDAFWAEVNSSGRTELVRGVAVPVPTDLPLRTVARAEQLAESESLDDVRALIGDVFGADLLDQLIDAGVGAVELRTLIAWAVAQGTGRDVTFRDAFEQVRDAEAGRGKAPAVPLNRAARRAGNSTGGPSKRTSAGNTNSTRRASAR